MEAIETLKFGLMMSFIPFTGIFLFLTVAWALVDISVRKLTRGEKAIWSLVVVLVPFLGALVYNSKVRRPSLARCKAVHAV